MFRQEIVIQAQNQRKYLVRCDGQEEYPLVYQDLEVLQAYTSDTNAAQFFRLFDQKQTLAEMTL